MTKPLHVPTRDRGAISVVMTMMVVICLAGGGLIVDGGRVMVARRHASNTAEAAARAAVGTAGPEQRFDPATARAAALSFAQRAGVPAEDVAVFIDGNTVTVTITERRSTVFLVLGGKETVTVRAVGNARAEYSE